MTDPSIMTEQSISWLYEVEPNDYEYYITADIYGNEPKLQTHLIHNYEKAMIVYTDLYNNKYKNYVRIYKLGRKAIVEWLGVKN